MRSRPALLAAFAAASLTSCSSIPPPPPPPPLLSPYPAAGYGYGYVDERIGPDLVRVVYYGPLRQLDGLPTGPMIDRAASEARDLALWRAAQIALAEGKPAFTIIEQRADTETLRRPGGWAYDPWWPPCYNGYWHRWSCRYWPPTYVPPIADGRARATLTVRLENRVTPRNVSAAATVRRMEQRFRWPAPPPGPPPGPPPS